LRTKRRSKITQNANFCTENPILDTKKRPRASQHGGGIALYYLIFYHHNNINPDEDFCRNSLTLTIDITITFFLTKLAKNFYSIIMKIYISLPISGVELKVARRRATAKRREIEKQRPGHQVITPFDVCPESDKPYPYYIGRDIEALMGCDAIYLYAGWGTSRGCQLEEQCAKIYHKQIFHRVSDIPEL
jgi:hypothetical protein